MSPGASADFVEGLSVIAWPCCEGSGDEYLSRTSDVEEGASNSLVSSKSSIGSSSQQIKRLFRTSRISRRNLLLFQEALNCASVYFGYVL